MQINKPYPTSKLNGFDWFGSRNTDWGVWPEKIEQTPDYKTSEYVIEFLKRDHDKPFFLNVGIYKPHSPFFALSKFFEEYPISELIMPELKEDPLSELPSGAIALLEARTGKDGISGSGMGFWNGLQKAKESNPNVHEEFVQAYQSASTFADAMVGRVIEALDKSPYRDNTIIVLWSDHGFHLGEKHNIEKFALWEKTTRVPLIIIAPGRTTPGTIIDKPVDLTSLYPTLIELAGLDQKKDIDGHSLVSLLKNPEADFPPALMTYLKGNHAIRKDNWRYIQYQDGSEELYDLSEDPLEWDNLANSSEYQGIIKELRQYVPDENADPVADYQR